MLFCEGSWRNLDATDIFSGEFAPLAFLENSNIHSGGIIMIIKTLFPLIGLTKYVLKTKNVQAPWRLSSA